MSSLCVSLSLPHAALTVDNILKEIKRVNWETLSDDDHVLELHESQRQRIEIKYSTEEARKQSAVQFFLLNHPYASWRLVITRLDWEREHAVADRLRDYAEKVTGMLISCVIIDSCAVPVIMIVWSGLICSHKVHGIVKNMSIHVCV